MTRLFALLCALFAAAAALEPAQAEPAEVEVVRDRERWTADFRFKRRAPVWLFWRGAEPVAEETGGGRVGRWTVETPGVRLERRGFYDALVSESGPVPELVRIRFTPAAPTAALSADDSLIFSDGSVALADDQFRIFSARSAAQADALPFDPTGHRAALELPRITFRDAGGGPVLEGGRRRPTATTRGNGAYVLFGSTPIVESESVAMVTDPRLPAWLRSLVAAETPRLLSRYAAELGPAPRGRPTIIAAWSGSDEPGGGVRGRAVDGLLALRFHGRRFAAEDAETRSAARWFIAHEVAHIWLGERLGWTVSRDGWIGEGGSDLLAIRAVAAIDADYDARKALQAALDRCIGFVRARPLATASERGEPDAHYACGTVFGLVAEASSGGSFSAFVRGLIRANRAIGVVGQRQWLRALTRASRDPTLARDIEALIKAGADDPKTVFASLFARAGVAHSLSPDGELKLL